MKRDILKSSIEQYIAPKDDEMPEGLQGLLKSNKEYKRIALSKIVVEKQVRSSVSTEDEQFKALVESIRENGVLQPILVSEQPDGNYRLISGERRYQASKILELKSIPAIIRQSVPSQKEIISLQLVENLQRENISPLDEAQAYYELFKLNLDVTTVDDCISKLITLERNPDRAGNNIAVTVTAIQKISGKSISSIRNLLTLLRLPEEIKEALSQNKITLSQAYVFASNLHHPRLQEIFQKAIEGKFTKDALIAEFRKVKKEKKSPQKY